MILQMLYLLGLGEALFTIHTFLLQTIYFNLLSHQGFFHQIQINLCWGMWLTYKLIKMSGNDLLKFAYIICNLLRNIVEFMKKWISESGYSQFFGGSFGLFANFRHSHPVIKLLYYYLLYEINNDYKGLYQNLFGHYNQIIKQYYLRIILSILITKQLSKQAVIFYYPNFIYQLNNIYASFIHLSDPQNCLIQFRVLQQFIKYISLSMSNHLTNSMSQKTNKVKNASQANQLGSPGSIDVPKVKSQKQHVEIMPQKKNEKNSVKKAQTMMELPLNTSKIDDKESGLMKMKLIYQQISRKKQEEQAKYDELMKEKKKNNTQKSRKNKNQKQLDPEVAKAEKQKKQLKQKIEQLLQPYLDKYKKALPIDLTQSEMSRFKTQQKSRLFKALMTGILEIRYNQRLQLTPQQQAVGKMTSFDIYNLLKKLCTAIEESIVRTILYPSPMNKQKAFRKFYKGFNNQLLDEGNFVLRSSILTNKLSPKQIPKKDISEFYSERKKQKIKERQSILLKQAQVVPQNGYVLDRTIFNKDEMEQQKKEKMQSQKVSNNKQAIIELRDYNQSTLLFLNQFLEGQIPSIVIKNICNILDGEKTTHYRQMFTANCEQVFKGKDEAKSKKNEQDN